MASLGIPVPRSMLNRTRNTNSNQDPDTEPLLGRPGDVTQDYSGFQWNVLTGTAAVAQGGIWVLTAIIWSAIFEHKWMWLDYHPLMNTLALLFLVQGILLLQPTATQKQKIRGAYYHSIFNTIALGLFIAGHVIIEIDKAPKPQFRYKSTHARLGLATYIVLYIQFAVGVTQFYTPKLYGSVDNAKKIYKYHRMSGYTILLLALLTVNFAMLTYINNTLEIRLWPVITTSVLVVLGVFPRIKKAKFGFKQSEPNMARW